MGDRFLTIRNGVVLRYKYGKYKSNQAEQVLVCNVISSSVTVTLCAKLQRPVQTYLVSRHRYSYLSPQRTFVVGLTGVRLVLEGASSSCMDSTKDYRDGVNPWVKGSVPVLFWVFHQRGGEEGGSAKFQNKAHRTFDPRNTSTPVYYMSPCILTNLWYYKFFLLTTGY